MSNRPNFVAFTLLKRGLYALTQVFLHHTQSTATETKFGRLDIFFLRYTCKSRAFQRWERYRGHSVEWAMLLMTWGGAGRCVAGRGVAGRGVACRAAVALPPTPKGSNVHGDGMAGNARIGLRT